MYTSRVSLHPTFHQNVAGYLSAAIVACGYRRSDPAGKHLCINHFRTGLCRGSSCRGIHLPDTARHSGLREAAVKPPASGRVFSLDDVRKVVRQELLSAHRGGGWRGNGSERRRTGEQEYWVAEKKRRRMQASHEQARRRSSMLFRIASQPALGVTALISVCGALVCASPLCFLDESSLRLNPSALLLCLGVSFRDNPPFLLLRRSADQKRLNLRILSRGPPRKVWNGEIGSGLFMDNLDTDWIIVY